MDAKKEQIIQSALRRFAHYGFDKTTMSEIAADMNITKANLYYYYPDKNALIKDVITFLSEESLKQQYTVIDEYNGNLVETLCEVLECRAERLKRYYILHIHKNMEWIKGQGIAALLEHFYYKDVELVQDLFNRAMLHGEIDLEMVEDAARSFVEIIEGLSLMRCVGDMILGMPDIGKVEEILKSQKNAIKFIFNNKIRIEN